MNMFGNFLERSFPVAAASYIKIHLSAHERLPVLTKKRRLESKKMRIVDEIKGKWPVLRKKDAVDNGEKVW